MKKLFLILLIFGMLVAGSFAGFYYQDLLQPIDAQNPQLKIILVKGGTFAEVLDLLESEGLIRQKFPLKVYARLTGIDRRIRRGEYEVTTEASPVQLLHIFASGKSKEYFVTVKEGWNIFDISGAFEAAGLVKKKEFLQYVQNPQVVKTLLRAQRSSLEGYLFPETYAYTRFTDWKQLVKNMVERTFLVYSEVEAKSAKLPLTPYEIITFASMVEKETGAPEERPLIASVFWNRLKIRMRLQSDPTTMYGKMIETGRPLLNITRKDLVTPTPYNTYTVAALPMGPISNPSREAIEAVFSPANSEYLFFVSKNDGTHIFTTSLNEHQKAVDAFQKNPKARAGKSWRDRLKK